MTADEEYTTHVNLDLEKKYNIPLHQVFSTRSHIETKLAKNAMVVPCFKEQLPYNGAAGGQVIS